MEIEEAKNVVCAAGKKLLKEGLVARTWGNVSVRINDHQMVITPSGRRYDELSPADMVLVDFYTLKFEGKIKPSSELKLHCQVYKTRPHIQSVIHTHQMYASIVAASQKNVEVANAALMANHGAVCIGTSLDGAFEVAHTLEQACEVFIESKKHKAI